MEGGGEGRVYAYTLKENVGGLLGGAYNIGPSRKLFGGGLPPPALRSYAYAGYI